MPPARVEERSKRVSFSGGQTVLLRPTTEFDLDWVVRTEHVPENRDLITQWPRAVHSAALRDPQCRHLIIADDGGVRLGYAILRGIDSPDASVELLRIVVAQPGRGTGRAALRLIKRMVFLELGAHRLWLDVVPTNARGRALYRSEGFVEEGILREAARRSSGFVPLVVMSILEQEYRGDG
jgi:diamine N-acetyltransferase